MNAPVAIDASKNGLTIAWNIIPDAAAYELEMATSDLAEASWKSLSNKIKSSFARKKNLQPNTVHYFRVRYKDNDGAWSGFSPISEPILTLADGVQQMAPPTQSASDELSITAKWTEVPEATGYQLQYRAEKDLVWTKINAVISGSAVRKKGLSSSENYFFSVKPVFTTEDLVIDSSCWAYSPSSEAMTVAKLSAFMSNLLPKTLLSRSAATTLKRSTADILAGKVVAIYFSAHWCGPCRRFTPMLLEAYKLAKAAGKPFEVVFVSADHSEEEFNGYFSSMSWNAVDYEDEEREQLMGKFAVSGIPQMTVLAPSGRIIVQNAAGQPISEAMVDQWIAAAATM